MEAKTPAAKKGLLDDAVGRPHFFRYLQIMDMQPVTEDGHAGVRIIKRRSSHPGELIREEVRGNTTASASNTS